MGKTDYQTVFEALQHGQLSTDEIAALRALFANLIPPDQCLQLIEAAAGRPPCPDCGSNRCHRCGQANGLQRYRCVVCRRSFNALTGTPLAYLRLRHKWLPFLQSLIESKTVRAAAKELAVAKSTSFRWRHRFIAAMLREKRPSLSGVVEADETYHLESQKGSRHLDRPARKRGGIANRRGISREFDCILVARDRNRHTYDFVTGRGPVTARQLGTHLLPVLGPDVLLVTDAAKAYQAFARNAGITHEMVNVRCGVRARGALHLQGVNAWHSRFKTWLQRFHGVASRYLANYTGWRRLLDAAILTAPAEWLQVAAGAGR